MGGQDVTHEQLASLRALLERTDTLVVDLNQEVRILTEPLDTEQPRDLPAQVTAAREETRRLRAVVGDCQEERDELASRRTELERQLAARQDVDTRVEGLRQTLDTWAESLSTRLATDDTTRAQWTTSFVQQFRAERDALLQRLGATLPASAPTSAIPGDSDAVANRLERVSTELSRLRETVAGLDRRIMNMQLSGGGTPTDSTGRVTLADLATLREEVDGCEETLLQILELLERHVASQPTQPPPQPAETVPVEELVACREALLRYELILRVTVEDETRWPRYWALREERRGALESLDEVLGSGRGVSVLERVGEAEVGVILEKLDAYARHFKQNGVQ
jgi:DNA repair exonuclease SbcCD ATPase subunit